jgi:hypothetical protein
MNTLVIILLVVAGIIVLALITGLFLKKDYTIEREIVINRPKQEVFGYLKHLKNQNNFSKWSMMDPKAVMDFRGTDGTVGFVSGWDSLVKQVGKGEQEITKIAEGERVDFALRFFRPFESHAEAYFRTESKGENGTRVIWGFHTKMKFPMNLTGLFMNMEKMVGDDLSAGLTNLKNLLEK